MRSKLGINSTPGYTERGKLEVTRQTSQTVEALYGQIHPAREPDAPIQISSLPVQESRLGVATDS